MTIRNEAMSGEQKMGDGGGRLGARRGTALVGGLLFVAGGVVALAGICGSAVSAQQPEAKTVTIQWDKPIVTSKSTATLQVVVNPMTEQGSPIHDRAFAALKDLGADYVRYVPWLPYPRLAVAELEPPTKAETS